MKLEVFKDCKLIFNHPVDGSTFSGTVIFTKWTQWGKLKYSAKQSIEYYSMDWFQRMKSVKFFLCLEVKESPSFFAHNHIYVVS